MIPYYISKKCLDVLVLMEEREFKMKMIRLLASPPQGKLKLHCAAQSRSLLGGKSGSQCNGMRCGKILVS